MESLKKDFLEMLSAYQGIIHKVCLIYFRSQADRQENFQEVVYHLWRSFTNLEDRDRVGSWIYNISINTSISKIRKDCRYVLQESFHESVDFVDPQKHAEKNEEIEMLLDAIRKLNDIDKSLMLLYLEEYSYDEIAEILGISKSNVGVRINRAKKELKTILINMDYGK